MLTSRLPVSTYNAVTVVQSLAPPRWQDQESATTFLLGADEETEARDVHALGSSATIVVDAQVRWIHFILGCCALLPYNVMMTATPYFLSRLVDSSFKDIFISCLSITFTTSRFISLGHAMVTSKRVSPSRRIRQCITLLSILCFLLTMSTYFRVPSRLFIAFILTNAAFQAATESYLQTSVVAVASLYGNQALQAMMSGQAAVAVAVSIVQVLSTALFTWKTTTDQVASKLMSDEEADTNSARAFFALSTLFLVFSAFAYNIFASKAAYKRLIAPLETLVPPSGATEAQYLMSSGQEEYLGVKDHILRVAKANITFEVAIAYVLIVTLAVFPPITTLVQPTNPATHPLLFNAIHFLVCNVGDLLGRYICSIPHLIIWSANWLLILSLSRTFFIPIFLMCNIQRPSSEFPATPVITSDLLFMVILFMFGLSSGYVSTLCMMSAPSLEHNLRLQGRKDIDVAATVANFSLVVGLVLGSVASFAVVVAMCACNPFIL